ncbi:MAG TPA: baseplate J/gp47 family protein [Bacteroidia bacterium]
MPDRNLTYINTGVSQDTRMPVALDPANIKIDGRDTIDMISFLGNYSPLLNYYKSVSEKLVKDGNWSFYNNNAVFRLAEIANTGLSPYKKNINLIASTFQQEKISYDDKIYAIRLLFDVISDLLVLSNKWLSFEDVLPKLFSDNLTKIVQNNLSPILNEVRDYAHLYEKYSHPSKYVYFDETILTIFPEKYWQQNAYMSPTEKSLVGYSDTTDKEILLDKTHAPLIEIARNIIRNITILITLAKGEFERIQKQSNIKPDLGLILAFLNLFKKAQQKQNLLSQKHLDFYYRNVLKLKEAGIVPDRTFLVMQLNNGVDGIILNKGTAFDAGKDAAGNTVVFNALKDTGLNQIQVADLRTLFIASEIPPAWPQEQAPLITGIYQAVQSLPIPSGFPVLGEDQVSSDTGQTMQETNLGFAFSSQALFLSGGVRTVTVTLNFADGFSSQIQSLVQAITGITNVSPDQAASFFNQTLANAFSVSATGTKNWFPVNVTGVVFSSASGIAQISITLVLNSNDPSIVAYSQVIHGADFTTPFPVLKFMVQHTYPYYAYNFLKGGQITKISIGCDVQEFRNISVYNGYGLIDTSKPFFPLGYQPQKGDYFLIGSNELFIKTLKEVDVTLEWQEFPSTGDFATYYQAYKTTPPVTNSSFQLTSSFLSDYKWMAPTGFDPEFDLFAVTAIPPTQPIQAPPVLSPTSVFNLKPLSPSMSAVNINPAVLPIPIVYNQNTTPAGFIKFELTAPQFGFGKDLFNNALTNTILENSKNQIEQTTANSLNILDDLKTIVKQPLPLPNLPFTPSAKSIVVHYTSADDIDLSPSSKPTESYNPFYHIDTFTTYSVSPDEETADYSFLLPEYSSQGTLYIGLQNVNAPESVSILFNLPEKAVDDTNGGLPNVTWSYLTAGKWKNFVPSTDLSDGTNGLTSTGIVTLDLPADISCGDPVMPGNICWIRVQATEQLTVFGELTAIFTQAIEVQYNGANPAQRGLLALADSVISKTIDPIPQIKSVKQPFASTGGIVAEDQNRFYTRVSELLRHKNRAILPWDYERIALQNFPQIYKAKCISNYTQSTTANYSGPGNVEMVVIPLINPGENFVMTDSRPGPVFGFTALEEIKNNLQQFTSAHTQVNICNPVYERLIVKCQVKFSMNESFLLKKLNDDICTFLSPWRTGNQIAYDIGNGLQKSTILAFIQQLSYVEFVTGFSIIKIAEVNGTFNLYDSAAKKDKNADTDNLNGDNEDSDFLYALTPYSVFASASQHLLSEISVAMYAEPTPVGIGNLSIDNDFIIQTEPGEIVPEKKLQTNFYIV